MPRRRALDQRYIDAPVERHEHAVAMYGKGEQVGVGDLPRVEPAIVREVRGLEHRDVVWPEFVVRCSRRFGQSGCHHVTEVTTAQKHVEYLSEQNRTVHGVLMMSHAIDLKGLVSQAKLMAGYGASAVVLMDSAGNYIPKDVALRVNALKQEIGVQVGFHAHNNLGVGVSNAISAIENDATIIDGSSIGLGAGAGNAPLESIIVNYRRMENTAPSLDKFLEMSHLVETKYPEYLPRTTSSSIQSGDAGVFSGFAPQVRQLAAEFGVSQEDLWQELGKRRLVAGQESMIREIAQDLMNL